MQLKIFFFCLFVMCVLFGAQNSTDAAGIKEKESLRRMPRFLYDDDKQGCCCRRRSSYILKDQQFLDCFENIKDMSFEQAAQEAENIYGYVADDWSQILDVVREDARIAIDYARQRFVVCQEPVQNHPQVRVEMAIFRIDSVNNSVTKRDLLLRVYSEGYRDYTCRSIIAKRWALIGAGFCPKPSRLSPERATVMQDYWSCVRYGPHEDLCELYGYANHKNVDTLYQMIYMQKYGILDDLAKEIESGKDEAFGDELERQNTILACLQEKEGQPCGLLDLAASVQNYFLPRGVVYEIASLVFSGKAVVNYSVKHKTCTLVPDGSLPPVKQGVCDELVLFQNWCEHMTEGTAILQTYLQGYRAYPPAKMSLFIKSFDVIYTGGRFSWEGARVLWDFLQRHAHIPPVWRWDVHMEIEGEALLRTFYHRHLDGVFEMHTRGTLAAVHTFAQPCEPERFTPGLQVKEFLCKYKNCGLVELAQFLRETYQERDKGNWPTVLNTASDFAQNIHYDIANDEFSWVDEPEIRTSTTEMDEAQEACVLRNKHPLMGADCLAFVLKSKGFPAGRERIRILFSALTVAGLVPHNNDQAPSTFLRRCKEKFLCLCPQAMCGTTQAQSQGEPFNDSRVYTTAKKAEDLYKNTSLQLVSQKTSVVQMRAGCFYRGKVPSAKRRKIFDYIEVSSVGCGANPESLAQGSRNNSASQRGSDTPSLAAQ